MHASIFKQDFTIPSDTPGISLHVRNKRLADAQTGGEARTVLLAHGATYGSDSLFDVALDGRSFMDSLALAGYDVYAVDVRGYGRSSPLPEMGEAPEAHEPLAGTEIGVRDFSTAADFVRGRLGLRRLNVIGMSWGGSVAGSYTARNADKVRRLGLVAPQWLSKEPIPLDPGGPLGAYRAVSVQAMQTRWLGNVPEAKRAEILPQAWFEAWAQTTLDAEQNAQRRAQGQILATNGPIQDVRAYWSVDRPFYNPSDIEVPVLLVHGEWDQDVPIGLAFDYFRHLRRSPSRQWLEVGEATHMLLLEKNRDIAYDALTRFLSAPLPGVAD